jgi:hypothetical protein
LRNTGLTGGVSLISLVPNLGANSPLPPLLKAAGLVLFLLLNPAIFILADILQTMARWTNQRNYGTMF